MRRYDFKYKDMVFSKNGGLDELIPLDRYVPIAYDGYEPGDTVVFIHDKKTSEKRVGEVLYVNNSDKGIVLTVKDRFDEIHEVAKDDAHRPLETEPHQMWDRWAKGASSVEKPSKRAFYEDEFRWLFDGMRYSLGGRIQLMLGQEFVTGEKANLTAYNCYVLKTPEAKKKAMRQFMEVLDVAFLEASVQRRGGGTGLNISQINTVPGISDADGMFVFHLSHDHMDAPELVEELENGSFDNVVVTAVPPREDTEGDRKHWKASDSVDGLFLDMQTMVMNAYNGVRSVISFDDLRERDAIVKGVNGRSSGAVSWMKMFNLIAGLLRQSQIDNVDFAEIYSEIVNLIQQGGSRRGALMLVCDVENKNIHKFIQRKKDPRYLNGANVSVGISDGFMEKVIKGKESHPIVMLPKEIREALDTWDMVVESAHASAEPGLVFLERMNIESNSYYYAYLPATNPCGEQPLPEYGVCNLGHHVLPHYYDASTNSVNWRDLERAIRLAVRLQDNIIDYTKYFLKENEEVQKAERRVGIGTMGIGTLLIRMGLRYGSDEGNRFIELLYGFIAKHTYLASIELAKERGAFPKYDHDKFVQSGFMKRLIAEFPEVGTEIAKHGIRNVTLLTQAPTGSTGTYIDNIPGFREKFWGTTTGVEPYFSWSYFRKSRLGFNEQTVDFVKEYMEEHGIQDYEDLPSQFVTAMEMTPLDHVSVQAAIQKYVDSSISKTVNCPNHFTVGEVGEVYLEAYKQGLKGVTVYRDGSRNEQVLSLNDEREKEEVEEEVATELNANATFRAEPAYGDNVIEVLEKGQEVVVIGEERGWTKVNYQGAVGFISPNVVTPVISTTDNSDTDYKVVTPEEFASIVKPEIKKVPSRLSGMREKVRYQSGDTMGKAYVHIYWDETGTPIEVWIEPTNMADKDMADALGRMTTQFLRFGDTENNVDQAVKHLKAGKSMMSLPAIVGRLLDGIAYGKIELPNMPEKKKEQGSILVKCQQCGEKAYDKVNCICHACGQSKCN